MNFTRISTLSTLTLALTLFGCDGGKTDTGDSCTESTWYGDADGDGYGGESLTVEACDQPDGFFETADDCDDLSAAAYPGGSEICDGLDNDCDGLTDSDDDDADLSTAGTYYLDGDGDGYGLDDSSTTACGVPDGYAEEGGDCDDADASISPATVWYADIDQDTYGSPDFTQQACEQPSGFVSNSDDCDDLSAEANPDGTEVCDGLDNDCNGDIDQADKGLDTSTLSTFYADTDSDGYGDIDMALEACLLPSGYSDNADDCLDTDKGVNPDQVEICADGLDNDCSGDAPECGIPAGTYGPTDADYTLTGENSSDYFGRSIAAVDLDADGTDELIVGAYGNDENDTTSGQVYVFYGLNSSSSASTADAGLAGTDYNNYVGYAVNGAGDVDGDGYEDLLIGGYSANSWRGTGYLVYGSGSALGDADLDDKIATAFDGISGSDYLGHSVSGVGDLNGDGYDDFAIGAYGDDDNGSSSGSIFLMYGTTSGWTGGTITDEADVQITGASSSAYVGYYDSFAGGDFDGDGNSDMAVGSYYNVNSYYGGVFVFMGATSMMSGTYDVYDADANIAGTGNYDYFGRRVITADTNDDGYEDIVAWEYYGGSDKGAVYVFTGSSSGFSSSMDAGTDAAHTLVGASTYDYFGRAMDAGDFNNDGNTDLLIGAGGNDTGGSTAGASYIYYGPLSGDYSASTADIAVYGDSSSEYLGYYGVAAGDFDGDGADDAALGAYGASSSSGEVLIFMGGGM